MREGGDEVRGEGIGQRAAVVNGLARGNGVAWARAGQGTAGQGRWEGTLREGGYDERVACRSMGHRGWQKGWIEYRGFMVEWRAR